MKYYLFNLFFLLSPICFAENNFHVIEELPNGFALYRYGKPTSEKSLLGSPGSIFAYYSNHGIQEVMVLSGNACDVETKCSGLKIIYDEEQSIGISPSVDFLKQFDIWVREARIKGKKIGFRCSHGCHRTGRLAGYYQMKYQHLTYEDASALMTQYACYFWAPVPRLDGFWPEVKWNVLYRQLQAMDDYIHGRPCSVNVRDCLKGQDVGNPHLTITAEAKYEQRSQNPL
ncbi:MAG: dual specificity protein phosphatase family protein [Deltaproteobacteria bacterium]|nr:dual specificity protein phosphatase family protein [Deltaproteobacteria bacterium]